MTIDGNVRIKCRHVNYISSLISGLDESMDLLEIARLASVHHSKEQKNEKNAVIQKIIDKRGITDDEWKKIENFFLEKQRL